MISLSTAMVELPERDKRKIVEALELIRATKRRADLESAIYTALTRDAIATAVAIANTFPQRLSEDQEAVKNALTRIEEKKLILLYGRFYQIFSKTPRSYDQCFSILGEFSNIGISLGGTLGLRLAEVLGQEEIDGNIYRITRAI